MKHWHRATLLGIVCAGSTLGGVAWLVSEQRAARRGEFEREVQSAAHQIAVRVRGGIEKHAISLAQMASLLRTGRAITEEEFYESASAGARLAPRVLRISAVDPAFRIRWVFPPEENRQLVSFDVSTHPEGRAVLTRARESREPVLSPPLRLIGNGAGFVLAVPVLRGEAFLGAVVASFHSQQFFDSLLLHDALHMYELRVLASGAPIYTTPQDDPPGDDGAAASAGFTIAGSDWEVQMRPRAAVVREHLRSGQAALWALGTLLALGAGAAAAGSSWAATGMRRRLEAQGAALRQTREKLDGAVRQLLQAEKLAALSDVVAGVAHEINNPLCSVIGYVQLALSRDLPAEVRRQMETVYTEAERMARIVNNLLTFARKHPPEKKHLGVNGIVEKTLELKAYHFRVNEIEIDKDLDPRLPMTMLDFHQIQQVVLNLLTNAEQAIRGERRGGRIAVRTRVVDGRIELRVSDDGPGIAFENMPRLFEPFFSTKPGGEGTGLGLALCYGIVQEHGGGIRAESEPGRGATFVVDLPIIGPPICERAEKEGVSADALPGLRILVIDDERSVQDLMVDLLSARGHHVDTASDVPEALQKIASRPHDLIITDIKMPNGSGKDIYSAVALKDPHLARRIVFTTGDGASGATKEFVQDTGNELVLKPYRIEQIERAIARAIHN